MTHERGRQARKKKLNMIVLSDEEDEVEEVKCVEKMGEVSASKPKENPSLIDDPDVCVIQEVIKYKKFPRGLVLGPPRLHEAVNMHFSNIRRKKVTETCPNTMKYVHVRKYMSSGPLLYPSILRRQLGLGEAIRLHERNIYSKLIQAKRGYGMASLISILSKYHNILSQILKNSFSSMLPPVASPTTPTRCAAKTKQPTVECVDLDLDSDNDVVEVPQGSMAPKDMKSDDDIAKIYDVMDLEQDFEDPCSLQTAPERQSPDIQYEAGTSSARSKQILDEDEPFINLVDSEEEVENEDLNLIASSSHVENKQKGNLAEKLTQQMIINDDDHKPVERKKHSEEDSEDDLGESSPKITREMEVLIRKAYRSRPREVIVTAFNLTILGKDIQTLEGNNWLNDQVINFYLSLIMERGKLRSYPSVYCFNTFFFVKLVTSGYDSLRRWTRKVDIFSYDMLLIPVHLQVHWCLAAVNFIEKKIEYYDSMRDNNNNNHYGQALLNYLQSEHLDKKKEEFNSDGWEIVNMQDIPEQMNGCDCGVFACMYAEYMSRLAKLTFSQEHMPYFRVKMAYEILTQKLLL